MNNMAAVYLIVLIFTAAINWSFAFPHLPEVGSGSRTVAEGASEMHWSAPVGTHGTIDLPIVEMGLRGSAGVRQAQDVLLYSTAVRRAGEKGYDQGYALGFQSNATIDHFRWVYAGEDGYTSKFQVMNGGLGFKYITLYFTSQDDHGIYYNISIYGRFDLQL
ncbi:uncharacterized protein LOC134529385 [Bacillus rossius redtenbacheri]|uniref:uncharacterized protein LOC134529385 n=1 Tax=Bacillus rossius redtenbacheri TaxID=93214 RepID=UPI002FDCCEFE